MTDGAPKPKGGNPWPFGGATREGGLPEPAPEVVMAANGVYWRRYVEDCQSCWGGRPKWAGTMPAPPCGACDGRGKRACLSMVPISDDNDPVLTPVAVYRLVGWEDHDGTFHEAPSGAPS